MKETDKETKSVTAAEKFMTVALFEAEKAKRYGEVPVGAVIVSEGRIIARSGNKKERTGFSSDHAEMLVIKKAQKKVGDWRLDNCQIYVTMEPCAMCAGALINARIGAIYFGAHDMRFGCCGTLMNLPEDSRFNHRCPVTGGILGKECGNILTEFFKGKRKER